MSAWNDAFATILADPDLAEAAMFYVGGTGAGVALRVAREAAIDPTMTGLTSFGSLRGQQRVTLNAAVVTAQPKPGDTLVIGGVTYRVESAEADELRISWRVTLSE